MPNKKLTKTGGREYPFTWTQTTPGTEMHLCDEMHPGHYRMTGMGPINNDGYAPNIPDNPTFDAGMGHGDWNAGARFGDKDVKRPKSTKP